MKSTKKSTKIQNNCNFLKKQLSFILSNNNKFKFGGYNIINNNLNKNKQISKNNSGINITKFNENSFGNIKYNL